jgi:hypothetical protein
VRGFPDEMRETLSRPSAFDLAASRCYFARSLARA